MVDEGKIKDQSIGRGKAWNGLRKSETTYRAAVESSFDAIIVLDTQRNIVSCNEAFLSLFGYEKGEVEGQSIRIIHPSEESYNNFGRIVYPVIMKKNVFHTELDQVRKDGTLLPVEISISAIKDMDGSIVGYVTILRDITERKHAEELLRESENKFHLLFENSLDPVFLIYGDKFIDCNEAAVKIMGCSGKEVLIGLYPEETSPETQPDGELSYVKARDIIVRTMREGSSRFEWVHKKINGEEFWTDVSLTVIPIGGKNFIYDVWRDITDRKNMEEALIKSETRYREMFENNPLPAMVYDLNSLEIVDVNKTAVSHYGYTYGEFTAMTLRELSGPEDVPALLEYIYGPELGTKKRPWRHVKKDGTVIDVEVSGHTLEVSGRRCRITIINDITDRKKAEQQLKESHEQLRILSGHVNKAREEERAHIAREMHDELGQMLTTLNMNISWIKKRLPAATADTLLFEKAEATSILIKEAIKRVQKVSAELRPVILDDFGLVPALEWAVDKFKKQTGINIQMTTGTGIDLNGECSTQIYRIVQESLTNVARHASATKLDIRLGREGDNIVLKIHDDGRGISDKEKGDPNSFGILGMRERTVVMGGEFTINGIRGKGTTVRVKIPVS